MESCSVVPTTSRHRHQQLRRLRQSRKLSLQQRYDHIIDVCSNYLARKLTVNNCIDIILFAKKRRLYRLLQLAAVFIDQHFDMVFTSDEFIELEPDHLYNLLTTLIYDEMTADDVKNAIMFWSKYKRSERKKYIDALLM